MGLSYTGMSCLDTAIVTGYKRVPEPPAKMMPRRLFFGSELTLHLRHVGCNYDLSILDNHLTVLCVPILDLLNTIAQFYAYPSQTFRWDASRVHVLSYAHQWHTDDRDQDDL